MNIQEFNKALLEKIDGMHAADRFNLVLAYEKNFRKSAGNEVDIDYQTRYFDLWQELLSFCSNIQSDPYNNIFDLFIIHERRLN